MIDLADARDTIEDRMAWILFTGGEISFASLCPLVKIWAKLSYPFLCSLY